MAHAMLPVSNSLFEQNLPAELHEPAGGYSFHYTRSPTAVTMTASRGAESASGTIEWILGSGAQGQTPLVYAPNGRLESRISYFPQIRQYGITVGQSGQPSPDALSALGVRQSSRDLQFCIGCHATAVSGDLQPVVPGIQCLRCHPGADRHAAGQGKPFNPDHGDARQQVRFCGNCHRLTAPVDDRQLENVRFQPLRLSKSRCFASGKLACTTCHPAHQDAIRKDAAFYNVRCLACHSSGPAHPDDRQKRNCIGCHMPYVELHPALKFTDHNIRVVKVGDFPPQFVRTRPAE